MGNDEPRIIVKKESDLSGQFVVEPLVHTFGHTVGNALRRVLLHNIEGAAVTSIRIEGINNEFQTIPGVREDVTEFMLNMRGLYVKMLAPAGDTDGRVLRIHVEGSGRVTGADIQCATNDVIIVNPDLYLCEITDEAGVLDVEMTVEKGYGFVLPEQQHIHKDGNIGIIPMASVFTPVIKVSYDVEPTRVGHDTHFERLVLNIETNGTVTPIEVLTESCKILIRQFNLIRSVAGDVSDVTFGFDGPAVSDHKLTQRVEDLAFGHRTANCLRRENIQTVSELLNYSESDLLKLRSFGKKSLDEVIAKLDEMGLALKK
ncbi:MAG: DNA-directed RNA polymerase subunit alpha [Abditibacteriota bacterium]|nr:DNA-directed RNA polymerase subunit alpha [Abditibacteriota bacterium]